MLRILLPLLLVCCVPTLVVAQSVPMRITGVLLAPDDDPGEKYPYVEVSLEGVVWKLRVRDVHVRTPGNSKPDILRHVGRFLILNGPPAVLDYVQSSRAEGVPLHFDGRLYLKKRVFLLSAVRTIPVETRTHTPPSQCIGTCPEPPVQQW